MAGVKISDLPAAPSAQLTDVYPVDQGTTTYKESNTQLLSLFKTNGEALTKVDDTNVTMTLGGSPSTAVLNATSMTLGWTGQLPVSRGGTGLSSINANELVYASTANTLAGLTTANSSGLLTNGSGVPAWVTATGTGSPVLSASPTFTGTPVLSTPTATSIQVPLLRDTNNSTVLNIATLASSSVNYFIMYNRVTGNGPIIASAGSDASVDFRLNTQAAGQFVFSSTSNTPFSIRNAGSYVHTTNFTMPSSSATRTVTFPDVDGTLVLTAGTSTMSSTANIIMGKANGTESGNAVTASAQAGVITTSSLTTAGGSSYAITWTNTFISTSSSIQLTLMGGTNTVKNITLQATAGSGTSTLTIYNNTAATALNGTLLIGYFIA